MFGYYDVRGIWGKQMDPWIMERLGVAVRNIVGGSEISVGRDVRICSLPAAFHLEMGLGGEVVDLGITTTPMVYYHAWKARMESIQVTASHNPPDYCGMKLVHSGGLDWSHEDIEGLKTAFERVRETLDRVRITLDRAFIEEYEKFYRSWEVPRMDLTFDPSNGAGYILIPLLREKFKLSVVNGVPDGRFPAHPPDPLEEKSRENLKKVKTTWGLMLDGDGDRLALSYKNRILETDEIVAFFAEMGVIGGKVLIEVMMPQKLEEFLEDQGIKVKRVPTGRAIIKPLAEKEDATFFAEYSGHMGFREFRYIDDPLFAFFKILETGSGKFETSYKPPTTRMFNIRGVKFDEEEILAFFSPEGTRKVDGIELFFPEGRIVIRPSKTEAGKVRVLIESEEEEGVEKLHRRVREWISHASL